MFLCATRNMILQRHYGCVISFVEADNVEWNEIQSRLWILQKVYNYDLYNRVISVDHLCRKYHLGVI